MAKRRRWRIPKGGLPDHGEALQAQRTAARARQSSGRTTSRPLRSGSLPSVSEMVSGFVRELAESRLTPKARRKEPTPEQLDKWQAYADVAGIADPTPLVDAGNALVYTARAVKEPERRKEHLKDAGISAVSAIPYVGDLAKVLRGKKIAKGVSGAGRARRAAAEPSVAPSRRATEQGRDVAEVLAEARAKAAEAKPVTQPPNLEDTIEFVAQAATAPQKTFNRSGDVRGRFTSFKTSAGPQASTQGSGRGRRGQRRQPTWFERVTEFIPGLASGGSGGGRRPPRPPVTGPPPDDGDNPQGNGDQGQPRRPRSFRDRVMQVFSSMGDVAVGMAFSRSRRDPRAQTANASSGRPHDPVLSDPATFGDVMGGKKTLEDAKREREAEEEVIKQKNRLADSARKLTGRFALVAGATIGFVKSVDLISRGLINRQRRLEEFSGPIAIAAARLDIDRIRRDIDTGRDTGRTFSSLTRSQSRLESQMRPYGTLGTNTANTLQTLLVRATSLTISIAETVTRIDDAVQFLNGVVQKADSWLETASDRVRSLVEDEEETEERKRKERSPMQQFIDDLAHEHAERSRERAERPRHRRRV